MASMQSPIILGNGLCASAVASAMPGAQVFSTTGKRPHMRVHSPWRPFAVVSNPGGGGLSSYYHGVTPASVLQDEACQPGLRLLGLNDIQVPQGDWNFVPVFVPRAWVRPNASLEEFDLRKVGDQRVYMCLSVIGNLQQLIAAGFLDEAHATDDIVFRLGTVDLEEGCKRMSLPHRTKRGVFHPTIRFPGGQVGLRPRFFRDVTMNFIHLQRNLLSIDPRDLAEKALRALYLRYGLQPCSPKGWDVYVQRNFANAYLVTRAGVTEADGLKDRFATAVEEEVQRMAQLGFTTFRRNLGEVMSGIHLGYDRTVLANLPPGFCMLDTSLNPDPGQHPTVHTFCIAHAIAARDAEV